MPNGKSVAFESTKIEQICQYSCRMRRQFNQRSRNSPQQMGKALENSMGYCDFCVSEPAQVAGLVPKRGLEPPRRFQRYYLKVVRLPIPPFGRAGARSGIS